MRQVSRTPVFRLQTRPVHWGCFVWTPTPPHSGQRTPLPGPALVCLCMLFLAGSGGPASRAHCGAPHLFLWLLCPFSLFGPLRAWVAPFAVVAVFLFLFFLSLVRPSCPWRSVCSGPGALGLGVLLPPPHPPPFFSAPRLGFFFSSLLLPCVLFVAFLFVFFRCLVSFFFVCCCAVRGQFVCPGLWGVLVCVAVCTAVCGVLCVLPRAVRCACAMLGSCALMSGAALWLVLVCCFCCVLLSRAGVFSAGFFLRCSLPCRGVPCCLGPWCVLLFGVALSRCVLVLVSVALCCLELCRAVVRLWVLCCVVRFLAVLGSCLVSSAAVACCCALSALGRGAVLSCCAACGPCAVVPCAVFLGASFFVAPLVWCCVGVPVYLLPVWCSLTPLASCCVLSPVVFGCLLFGLPVLCCLLVAPGVVFR